MNKYSYFQHPNVDILKDKDFLTNDLLTYHGGGLISEVKKDFQKNLILNIHFQQLVVLLQYIQCLKQ